MLVMQEMTSEVHMHAHKCTCTHTSLHTCTPMNSHAHIHMHTHLSMHTHLCEHTHVSMHVYTCPHTQACTHVHTCTNTQTCTFLSDLQLVDREPRCITMTWGVFFSRCKHFNRCKDDPKKNTVYEYLGNVFRLREEKKMSMSSKRGQRGWDVVN